MDSIFMFGIQTGFTGLVGFFIACGETRQRMNNYPADPVDPVHNFSFHFSPNFLPPTSSEALLHRLPFSHFSPITSHIFQYRYSSACSVTFLCCLKCTHSAQKCTLLQLLYLKRMIFLKYQNLSVYIIFYTLYQIDKRSLGIF